MKFYVLVLAVVVGQAMAGDAEQQKKARRAKRELQRKKQEAEQQARVQHNLRVNLAPEERHSAESSSSRSWRPEPRRFLGVGSSGEVTFEPGCFDWGIYIRE